MKTAVFLALLASAVAVDRQCGSTGLVAVPRDTESFECFTVQQLQQQEQLENSTPFDAESETRFFLWTQHTKEGDREELKFNDRSALAQSTFNPANPTRILIHGWLNDWTSDAVQGLAKAYVAKGAYNVIGIDWSTGAATIIYLKARMRVDAVADAVAKQIDMLLEVGQNRSQIVLIGHSLGAHIAGLTGKHFQGEDKKLAAVVALDPAGPLFHEDEPSTRVDASDAQYVEVIHTNKGRLGHPDALGQADFYPNGGQTQPGCLTSSCSHHQAVEYYRNSLATAEPMYVGRRCTTTLVNDQCDGAQAVMGGDLNDKYKVTLSGLFYLAISK